MKWWTLKNNFLWCVQTFQSTEISMLSETTWSKTQNLLQWNHSKTKILRTAKITKLIPGKYWKILRFSASRIIWVLLRIMINFILIMRYNLLTLSNHPTNQNKRKSRRSSTITSIFSRASKMISTLPFQHQANQKKALIKIKWTISCQNWIHFWATVIIYFKPHLTKTRPKLAEDWAICIRGFKRLCLINKVKMLRRNG